MKTYKKMHTNKKAAISHQEKIEKRGGVTTLFKAKGKEEYTLYYNFPKEKNPAKKNKKKQYDILSPDGKTIRHNVPPFASIKESREYFDQWKTQYARRGYWSPKMSLLIPMAKLWKHCKRITL